MGLDRDFLTMLEGRMVVERFTGEDEWGNDTYDVPMTDVPTYIETTILTQGAQDGQGKQDTRIITTDTMMTDAIGLKPKDRFTLPGPRVVYASEVQTAKDEYGQDLYQTTTALSVSKG